MSEHRHTYGPISASTEIPDLIVDMACLVDDPRLNDARIPTTHTHPQSDVTGLTSDLAAKQATTEKNAVSGYAGLNAVSRTTKGVDATDDLIVDNSAKGLVLKDSITSHYFRITLSAGVIGLSDLGTTKP